MPRGVTWAIVEQPRKINRVVDPGAHAVLIVDGAGCKAVTGDVARLLPVPDHIKLVGRAGAY